MIVSKKHFYNTNTQRGASVLEVVLAITVVLAVSPFVYTQTIKMANDVRDIANANKIVSLRDGVINFIRVNQSQWPDTAEIKMSEEDLKNISPSAHSGFIDKYSVILIFAVRMLQNILVMMRQLFVKMVLRILRVGRCLHQMILWSVI